MLSKLLQLIGDAWHAILSCLGCVFFILPGLAIIGYGIYTAVVH